MSYFVLILSFTHRTNTIDISYFMFRAFYYHYPPKKYSLTSFMSHFVHIVSITHQARRLPLTSVVSYFVYILSFTHRTNTIDIRYFMFRSYYYHYPPKKYSLTSFMSHFVHIVSITHQARQLPLTSVVSYFVHILTITHPGNYHKLQLCHIHHNRPNCEVENVAFQSDKSSHHTNKTHNDWKDSQIDTNTHTHTFIFSFVLFGQRCFLKFITALEQWKGIAPTERRVEMTSPARWS